MNRGNKILLGVLAFVVMCVIGYALFSESITISGSASASGDFKITTTCVPGYSDEVLIAFGLGAGNNDMMQSGFENDTCVINNNVVTINTDLLYPSAERVFTVKMTNTGSIPAIIWGSTTDDLVDSLNAQSGASYSIKSTETDEVFESGNTPYINFNSGGGGYFFSAGYRVISKDGVLDSEDNIVYDSANNKAGIKLNPGDSLFSMMTFTYHDDFGDKVLADNGISEYFEFKLNHEFYWEQYTDNENYESGSFSDYCFDNGC